MAAAELPGRTTAHLVLPLGTAHDKKSAVIACSIGTGTTDQGELIDAGDDVVEEKEGEGEGCEHTTEQ
eukprot:1136767-Pelagomonas_calceolata.AAC.5